MEEILEGVYPDEVAGLIKLDRIEKKTLLLE